MKQWDSLKHKRIDTLGLRYHLMLLLTPLSVFVGIFYLFSPAGSLPWMILLLVCLVYLMGYSLSYYLHQGRLQRLWDHLEQVVSINEASMELIHLSSQYQNEHAFLDALLNKAVSVINGAEMGSIIRVDPDTHKLMFESAVGLDLSRLRTIDFSLEQSFEYRMTKGRCDKVVVIDDMQHINAQSTLTPAEQQILLTAAKQPIRSTLSSPIHIDGKLYAMLNLDSSHLAAFSDYDRNLVAILTHEAASAIALYQKSREIQRLATFDILTGLHNRQYFESQVSRWPKSRIGSYLVVLDLDNLKVLNDSQGHQAGDKALAILADALKMTWSQNCLISRFGGDEFVILTQSSEEQLLERLEQLKHTMARAEAPVLFSAGFAPFNGDFAASFKLADERMYAQKRGRQKATSSQSA
ncbi:GGDEF domain-containing protein [Shewanella zhangzhouensis]|uniref:GGDEF domain-containing protein n=1 Tax=Shewanella zhangzhouensis TaxID=2864213 RepID=UPI001C65A959|nr:sensor domain-containing diguanylate cyclase [Shewanella zhangzhouensis]QYK06328.1 sensor domain-containing diguanylate cyclase [Shewanella zhangzhouensis]